MKYQIILLLILANSILSADDTINSDVEKQIIYQTQKFKYLLETSVKYHIDSIDIEQASEAAYKAMLKSLDVQSDYFSAKQLKDLQERNLGAGEGVGIQVTTINDSVVVASITENSPADSADIHRGDFLLFVNDKPVTGLKLQEIQDELNGKVGTSASVITRSYRTGELKSYLLTRREVRISSISTEFLIPKTSIGYILSNRFSARIDEEILDAVKALQKKGMKRLILDLRGNPGGYLDQVVKLLDEFLPAGCVITYTDAKNPEFDLKYESTSNGNFEKMPIVVIIDENSASASEIFAGAMQDLDRGIVVGTKSFGKGTVQKMWNLNDGSGFRITVAEYHTASGRQIDKDIQKKLSEKAELDESLKLQLGEDGYKQLKGAMEATGGRSKMPIFKSKKGRTIIGGGGIVPDFHITSDTTTLLTRVLQTKGVLLQFSFNYFKNNEDILKNRFKTLEQFIENFNIDDLIYNDFVKFSFTKNIWNETMAKSDEAEIRNLIKANLAHFIWDNYGYYAVKVSNDIVLKKAVQEIENAVLLID